MTGKKSNSPQKEYGYQPKRNINGGYQPSEERGYQPSLTSNEPSTQSDNPPSGGSSAESNSDE